MGTATTGRPHAQLLDSGCEVVVLLADTHAFLDNLKAPIELVENRAKYYQKFITAILEAVGVSTDKLEVVLGGSYQKSPNYIMNVYRLSSLVSGLDAKKAGAEILKQSSNARLSGLLYPILQVLDEEYLRADAELGGTSARKDLFLFCIILNGYRHGPEKAFHGGSRVVSQTRISHGKKACPPK